MRKLLPIPVLALLALGVPAALAATGEERDATAEAALVSSSFASDPFDPAEARRSVRTAARRAAREARPPEPKVAVPPQLEAIAACESGGDPAAVSSTGAYRGKYQFSVATWQAVGGQGDPAAAPEAEQDRRAAILYAQSGPGQWPVCGQ